MKRKAIIILICAWIVIFALAGLTLLIDSVSGLNQKVPASLTLIVAFLMLL